MFLVRIFPLNFGLIPLYAKTGMIVSCRKPIFTELKNIFHITDFLTTSLHKVALPEGKK